VRRTGHWRARARALVVTALLVGLPASATAQAPAASDEPWSLAALGLKGFLIFKNFSHFRESYEDERNFREEGLLQLEWSRRLAPWADARLIVEARGDDGGLAEGFTFQIPETARHRSILGVKEATLRGRAGPIEAALGKQIYAWGTADAWNPTDNLNPYDYLDPIDNEKIGVWSASARATAGPGSLTFVLVPVFTPSRTPLSGGRWVPPPPGVVLAGRELPGRGPGQMQYAARARVTVLGWDLSASYFDGFEHVPVIRQSETAIAPGVVVPRLTPVYTRMKVAGADFSTTLGKLEIHGEGAAKFVERNGRHDRFHGIFGINYAWDELGFRWLDQVTLIAEYARETILRVEDGTNLLDPAALNAFRDAFVSRLQFKFTEDTQLKLSAILDLTRQPNDYLQAKVSHKLTDALHLEAGLDFFAGLRESFYGRWKNNDRFFFSAKYYF